ncbi:copper resistance protein CopC [Streptomyces sp. NPDC007084]|uniref:copper resistance CopC/CopD family protein n=1 Tax=Streptomyces sp. NPDC007084 TaxID=3154313 RepID=UPI00345722B9
MLAGVLTLVLFTGVSGASAHAALTGTDPRDGSVLKSAPRQVTLRFSESVGLLDDSFRVLTPENRRVHTGAPRHVDGRSDTASVTLPRGLGTGTFTVAWRVVSADSHPVSGAFTFSIGKPSATAAPLPSAAAGNPASAALYDIARYAAYSGLALLIGAATFVLACGFRGSVRRLLHTGWWTLISSTVALLLLRGPYERGTGIADALDPTILSDTLTSRPGIVLVVRLALLAGAVLLPLPGPGSADGAVRGERRTDDAVVPVPGEGRPGRVTLALGGLLALGLAVTWAAAEHASAGIQVPVAMVSSVLHLLAMAVWLGGLTALLTALHRPAEPVPPAVVTRFSRLALTSVAVLAATGVYQSWRGLGSWNALTSTSYGRLLLAKVAVVALLLAGAAVSRRWTTRLAMPRAPEAVPAERVPVAVAAAAETTTTPSADEPPDEASFAKERQQRENRTRLRGLRRSVLAEVTVGILVLVITTMLTGTQPGRAAEETATATAAADQPASSTTLVPFDVGTPGGHGKVQVELSPGRVGENSVQAVIIGPDGGIATVPELRITFTLKSQRVGPIDAEITDKGGYWTSDTLALPLPGTWTMKTTIRTTAIDQVTVERPVRVN